ncbi:MAG: flagellin [Pseudomonadota bacterium]
MVKPISTFGQTAFRNSQLRRLEGELATASQEIATGKKDDIAKAIGSELVSLQTIRNQFGENQAYLRSISVFKQRADTMDGSLAEIEDAVNSLVKVAAINAASPLESASTVQLVANSAIDRIVASLNVEIGGRYLFGGAEVENRPAQPRDVGNLGGIAPQDLVSEVITGTTGLAGFPTTDLTIPADIVETTELLARFDDVFQGGNAANVSPAVQEYSFENTFYNGELSGTLIDIRLPNNSYQRQTNDALIQGLRDVFQGAYILASVELDQITDDDAYQQLMTGDDIAIAGALDLLAGGLATIQRARTDLGLRYQQVEASEQATLTQNALFNNQIVDLENADPFETQTRFLNIEKQLEASYAASSRVLSLSLFNFIR